MSAIPTLYTPRLILRPFTLADAKRVQELAGDARVAATTLRIPHPYPDGAAASWIATHQLAAEHGENYNFAITLAGTRTPGRELDSTDTGHLIGTVGLCTDGWDYLAAELGYWIGVPWWNKGFATEAAGTILKFAFERLRLARIVACHVEENLASGRVMQKIGMTRQPAPRASEKEGHPIRLIDYLVTRDTWSRRNLAPRGKPVRPATITI